jgi:hypothetical protein
MLLQEREICTLQSVMDANNFSILWTEESWVGNKTLVYIIPTKGTVSIWNKNHQSQLNSTEREMKQYFYLIPKKKKNSLPWRNTESLLCCHMVGWLAGPQWSLEGHRVAVRTLVKLFRNHAGGFLFVWTRGGVSRCGRLLSMRWTCVHPSSLEEEGK